MAESPGLIFVYGTLRSDVPARFKRAAARLASLMLEEEADLVGRAWCEGALYDVKGAYPALTPGPGGRVVGQLWRLRSPDALSRIDSYEGSDYVLSQITVRLGSGEEVATPTYMWVAPLQGLNPIPSGDYLQWLTERERSEGPSS
jgi:gamma-glutamylcyclotransferase (GGCT)/AIG2-like uncharacterized protein YtfP